MSAMRNAWTVSAVFLITMFAGCAGSEDVQAIESVDAPVWAAGHAFAYNITGFVSGMGEVKIDGEVMEAEGGETITIEDQRYNVYEVLNASYDGAYMTAARFGSAAGFAINGAEIPAFGKLPLAIRHADLSPMPVELSQTQRCEPGCRLATTELSVGDAVMDPYLAFPLETGKAWTNDVPLGGEAADFGAYMILESQVMGMETVPGPDGDVDAIKIVHTLKLPFDEGFLQLMAQQSGMQDAEVSLHLDGAVTSYYAPELKNVVRETMVMDLALDFAYTDDGQRIEIHAEAASDIVTYLAGYSFDEGTDLDEQSMFDFFDSARTVRDPTGAVFDYVIDLVADRNDFNVAEDGLVNFAVGGDLPEGDVIRYSISDGRGNVLDTGVGNEFSYAFDEAGLYGVYAQATSPAGIPQAAAELLIAADYEGSIELLCGHAVVSAVPNSGSCTAADIPVYTAYGLQDVLIETKGSAVSLQGGEIVVADTFTEVRAPASNGEGSLTLADLSELNIGLDGWTVTWDADLALEPSIEAHMLLDYGAPEPVSADPAATGEQLLNHVLRFI